MPEEQRIAEVKNIPNPEYAEALQAAKDIAVLTKRTSQVPDADGWIYEEIVVPATTVKRIPIDQDVV